MGLAASRMPRTGTHRSRGTRSGCHTWGCAAFSLQGAGGTSCLQGEKQGRRCRGDLRDLRHPCRDVLAWAGANVVPLHCSPTWEVPARGDVPVGSLRAQPALVDDPVDAQNIHLALEGGAADAIRGARGWAQPVWGARGWGLTCWQLKSAGAPKGQMVARELQADSGLGGVTGPRLAWLLPSLSLGREHCP